MTDRQRDRLAALRRAAAKGLLSQIEWALVAKLTDVDESTPLTTPVAYALTDLWARAMNRVQEACE